MPNKNLKFEYSKLLQTFENLILTGVFKPRERLIEADLAQRLNVSRYWIRDTLKIMETKGLVQIIPYKGAIVADLSKKEIEDIFVVRVALERLAIRLALPHITDSNIKVLKKLAGQFQDFHKNNNIQEMINTNTEFHDYIFKISDNQPLIQLIDDFRTRLHIIRYAAWSSPEVFERIVEEHQQYIKALQEKDMATLDELSEKHISYSKDFYLAQLNTVRALLHAENTHI
jgi:DNA-binding GntR family transcriptional regulator